jgi:6,7-dimethyl-8-ribityllumazine synthase
MRAQKKTASAPVVQESDMPTTFEGHFTPPTGRFALVAGRFNHFVVEHLVAGALDGLKRHGVPEDAIDLAWVPGSFEIPVVAQR